MVPATEPAKKQSGVLLELNPATGVSEFGTPPLLTAGTPREFTATEARSLLELTDPHGTPHFRIVKENTRG